MVEMGKEFGFIDEAPQAGLVGAAMALRTGGHQTGPPACGEGARHVFLESDLAFKGVVPGQVDDAEAAFPDLSL